MRHMRRAVLVISFLAGLGVVLVLAHLDARVRAYRAGPPPGGPRIDAEPAPAACRSALLAAEDRNFFRHPGIDPLAIVRALVADVRHGAAQQGASTLTQQLVKNAFLSPRRTLWRKAQEAVLAVLLEV